MQQASTGKVTYCDAGGHNWQVKEYIIYNEASKKNAVSGCIQCLRNIKEGDVIRKASDLRQQLEQRQLALKKPDALYQLGVIRATIVQTLDEIYKSAMNGIRLEEIRADANARIDSLQFALNWLSSDPSYALQVDFNALDLLEQEKQSQNSRLLERFGEQFSYLRRAASILSQLLYLVIGRTYNKDMDTAMEDEEFERLDTQQRLAELSLSLVLNERLRNAQQTVAKMKSLGKNLQVQHTQLLEDARRYKQDAIDAKKQNDSLNYLVKQLREQMSVLEEITKKNHANSSNRETDRLKAEFYSKTERFEEEKRTLQRQLDFYEKTQIPYLTESANKAVSELKDKISKLESKESSAFEELNKRYQQQQSSLETLQRHNTMNTNTIRQKEQVISELQKRLQQMNFDQNRQRMEKLVSENNQMRIDLQKLTSFINKARNEQHVELITTPRQVVAQHIAPTPFMKPQTGGTFVQNIPPNFNSPYKHEPTFVGVQNCVAQLNPQKDYFTKLQVLTYVLFSDSQCVDTPQLRASLLKVFSDQRFTIVDAKQILRVSSSRPLTEEGLRKCSYLTSTLVLARNKYSCFGGFVESSIISETTISKAFLFELKHNVIFQARDRSTRIKADIYCGIQFGNDLGINFPNGWNKFRHYTGSYCSEPYKDGYDLASLFGGAEIFKLDCFEVYELKFKQ